MKAKLLILSVFLIAIVAFAFNAYALTENKQNPSGTHVHHKDVYADTTYWYDKIHILNNGVYIKQHHEITPGVPGSNNNFIEKTTPGTTYYESTDDELEIFGLQPAGIPN